MSEHFTIKAYEEVFSGKRKRFPKGAWDDPSNAVRLVRYLIEEKLNWTREEICDKLDHYTFKEAKLDGMLQTCFGSSCYEALQATYPDEYMPWELKNLPKGFWTLETCKETVKWLVEKKLKWTRQEVQEKMSYKVLKENKLRHMIDFFFKGNVYAMLEYVYPGEYKQWELKHSPKGTWTEETALEATKWLIEEKLNWSHADVCKKLTRKAFADYGLRGMFSGCFNNSTYKALEATYPGMYMPWELKQTPRGFWNEETAIQATRWLVEEKLQCTPNQALEKVSVSIFRQYGLGGMLMTYFSNNPRKAIKAVYKEKEDTL